MICQSSNNYKSTIESLRNGFCHVFEGKDFKCSSYQKISEKIIIIRIVGFVNKNLYRVGVCSFPFLSISFLFAHFVCLSILVECFCLFFFVCLFACFLKAKRVSLSTKGTIPMEGSTSSIPVEALSPRAIPWGQQVRIRSCL